LEAVEGGTLIAWAQDFDDEKAAEAMAPVVLPANEQLFDKLQAIVEG
jgi:hypothetical protein